MPETQSTTLGYVKALVWPAFALFAVFAFWTPAHRIADTLPQLFENSESLSAGSFTVKVSKSLASKFSSDDLKKVKKLSPEDIRAILSTRNDRGASLLPLDANQEDVIKTWKEVEQIGLIRKLKKDELETASKNDNTTYDVGFFLTDQYWRVRELLVEVAVQAIAGQNTNTTDLGKDQPTANPGKAK